MNFFDSLGDAFEDQSGWFMLGGMLTANNIAKSQRDLVSIQRDAVERERKARKEDLRLQRQTLEALERKHQQEKDAHERKERKEKQAAVNLKKFRSLLCYCELLQQQVDPFGCLAGTMEILRISLESLYDQSVPSLEDTTRYQHFCFKLDHSSKEVWARERSSCFENAVKILTSGYKSLLLLADINNDIQRTNCYFGSLCEQAVPKRNLLITSLAVAGSPYDELFDSPSAVAAKAQLLDRSGFFLYAEEDAELSAFQLSAWNKSLLPLVRDSSTDINRRISYWQEKHPQFRVSQFANLTQPISEEKTRPEDNLVTLGFSGHTTTLIIDTSIQGFLGIFEQKLAIKRNNESENEIPEYRGLDRISESAVTEYKQFISVVERVNDSLQRSRKILELWEILQRDELVVGFHMGIAQMGELNERTRGRVEAAKHAERLQRLNALKNRRGSESIQTSRFDRLRAKNQDRDRKPNLTTSVEGTLPAEDETTGVSLLWENVCRSHQQCKDLYREALSPAGKLAATRSGSYLALERGIREFHYLLGSLSETSRADRADDLRNMVSELRPAFELADICLAWPASEDRLELPIDVLVGKLPRRQVSQADAYINALCAMAACDGDFCAQEKFTVNKWAIEAKLGLTSQQVIPVIEHWCTLVRDQSLSRVIAQSIVDCSALRSTPLASKFMQGVSQVLRADGKTTSAESELFKLIQLQLQ